MLFFIVVICQLPMIGTNKNPNSFSRLALVSAIVERGTTQIDHSQEFTVDKAFIDGHYYSDKAPGMALAATPIYFALRQIGQKVGVDFRLVDDSGRPDETVNGRLTAHLLALGTSGFLTVIAALALYFCALRLSASPAIGVATALTYAVATPIWGWSTLFFGHAAAAACLILAFCAIEALDANGPPKRNTGLTVFAGIFAAWAVAFEYPTAPAVLLLACMGLWKLTRFTPQQRIVLGTVAAIAAIIAAIPMLVYHTVSFGGPFSVGYNSVVGFEGMEQGFLGLTRPRLEILYELTFGLYRGLFIVSPVLFFSLIGLWLGIIRPNHRLPVAFAGLIIIYFMLYNASYYYWDGGFSFGPRHVSPAIGFMAFALIFVWTSSSVVLKRVTAIALGVSIGIAFLAAATNMTPMAEAKFPLVHVAIHDFFSGENKFWKLSRGGVPPIFALGVWASLLLIFSFFLFAALKQTKQVPMR